MVQQCFASTVVQWALGRSVEAGDRTCNDATAIEQGVASGFAQADLTPAEKRSLAKLVEGLRARAKGR